MLEIFIWLVLPRPGSDCKELGWKQKGCLSSSQCKKRVLYQKINKVRKLVHTYCIHFSCGLSEFDFPTCWFASVHVFLGPFIFVVVVVVVGRSFALVGFVSLAQLLFAWCCDAFEWKNSLFVSLRRWIAICEAFRACHLTWDYEYFLILLIRKKTVLFLSKHIIIFYLNFWKEIWMVGFIVCSLLQQLLMKYFSVCLTTSIDFLWWYDPESFCTWLLVSMKIKYFFGTIM